MGVLSDRQAGPNNRDGSQRHTPAGSKAKDDPSGRDQITSLGWLIRLVSHPLAFITLIAVALYIQWTLPRQIGMAMIPLGIGLVAMLMPTRLFSTSWLLPSPRAFLFDAFPATHIQIASKLQRYWLVAVFILAPLVLVLMGVIGWPYGVYASLCSLVLLVDTGRSASGSARAGSTGGKCGFAAIPPVSGSSRQTAAWFALVLLGVGYAILTVWPHLDVCSIRFPMAIAHVTAWLERLAESSIGGWELGAVSSSVGGDSHPVITRSQSIGLLGNRKEPTVLLLSTQHIHALLLLLLLIGSVIRSLLLERSHRLRSVVLDFAAAVLTLVMYVAATWSDVLRAYSAPGLFPVRMWGALFMASLWLVIRLTLVTRPTLPAGEGCDPTGGGADPPQPSPLTIPPLCSTGTILCGVILVLGVLLIWHEPGTAKPGRIQIDELHSDWEKSDLPMVTDVYGVKTTYNYSFLKEILEKHYPSVHINRQQITRDSLRNCDVLILKTPTKPYLPEEVQVIHDYVHRGGGLLLIGDHTNIFGMNTYLNQVSRPWGLLFNPDAICPLQNFYQEMVHVDGVADHSECGERKHEVLYSRRYLNHPIIGHNIPYLAVLTSCSVTAPLWCETISISRGTFADHSRFGGNTFFGNFNYDGDENYGCILQNAALKIGRGRVAVWSDSTVFSNFAMCMSGVPQLALGYVNWLNRTNWLSSRTYKAILAALLAISILVVAVTRQRVLTTVYGTLAAMILLAGLVPFIDRLNAHAYAIGDIRKGFMTVGFDQQYSQIDLPNKDHIHQTDAKVFETFYIMMQRLHLMPVSADRFSDLSNSDAIVLINPVRNVDSEDVMRIRRALEEGKTVMLMLNGAHKQRMSDEIVNRLNMILAQLGVSERFKALKQPMVTDLYGMIVRPDVVVDQKVAAFVDACDQPTRTLLSCAENNPLITVRPFGKGTLILCSVAELYNNPTLGQPGTVPDRPQAVIIRSVFRLMEQALKVKVDEQQLRESWKPIFDSQSSVAPGSDE